MGTTEEKIFIYNPINNQNPIPIFNLPLPLMAKPRKADNAKVKPMGGKVMKGS